MNDCLNECGFVDYLQENSVHVNDVVYLYSTAPIQRIEFKLIVERIDIPYEEEADDDSRYRLESNPRKFGPGDKFFRLRLLKQVETPTLSLQSLRQHGLKPRTCMQGPIRLEGEKVRLLMYIEEQFKE